jgi:hypothetical protein
MLIITFFVLGGNIITMNTIHSILHIAVVLHGTLQNGGATEGGYFGGRY